MSETNEMRSPETATYKTYTRGAEMTIITHHLVAPRRKINWQLQMWRAAAIIWMISAIKYGAVHFVW